ncbi:MAG TPA: NAD(P)/FAD-dependent oxidoreductase [Ilumatobacteraceae bacterium]|nr:NAD(P)/FAD-dependent oxidoreductase [Ilumatobacteraceae bacterium]
MNHEYDAIIVGARCAGSPTAMLLARRGHRVLVVDRASFPSDTVSTHLVHAPGVAALERFGLLDAVTASGCPPIRTYRFDFGPFTIAGAPRPIDGCDIAYAPRRTVLDKVLVDGARDAGVEVRERFTVDEVTVEDGKVVGIRGRNAVGTTVTDRARVVIGADGRNSMVAKAIAAEPYHEKPMLQWSSYTYFRDLPTDGMETYIRPGRGWGAFPTNDGLTLVVVGWPYDEVSAYKADVENNYFATLALAPEFAARAAAATRVERFTGGAVANFFRKPFGPGWALVGDAGYNKDPITAQGISDAFHDAELCSEALHSALVGSRPFDEAMLDFQVARDEHAMGMYELTTQLATLQPPPPELAHALAAVSTDEAAMAEFVSVVAGTVSPMAFFDPANIGRIMSAAAVAVPA